MANLVITNACNLGCPFCFASEYRADGDGVAAAPMSLAELASCLSRTGDESARFCGGEPTLHPELKGILDLAYAQRSRRVFVMTNGLWPEAVRRHFAHRQLDERERTSFLINVLPAPLYPEPACAELEATLSVLDPTKVALGVTLSAATTDLRYLFALAERFGIRRIRYSVASPTITDARSWPVDQERELAAMAPHVVALVRAARQRGIVPQADCGYVPPCLFAPDEIAELERGARDAGDEEGLFHCHGPVDIGPLDQSWRCYGLYATMRARTSDFPSAGDLALHFDRRLRAIAALPLLERCADCDRRARGACGGGCYAARVVERMRRDAAARGVGLDDEALREAVPERTDRLLLFRREGAPAAEPVLMMRDHEETWGDVPLTPDELALIEACDGERRVREIIELARHEQAAAAAPAPAPAPAPALSEARALKMIRRFFAEGGLELRRG